ncbi:AraC family transcriptional regulator [Streptomyces sp. NPDC092296]|uniref:AraC family transcriptional regulator n=1 Tax=Streptomyces sp. NPDC092296 TaxID=3366012 RepID=UPI003812484C
MDVVSDAITALRVGRPLASRVRVHGAWSRRFAAYGGAGFHVVLEGGCWLLPDSGPPITMVAGDVVLLPRGSAHVLADAPLDRRAAQRAVLFEPRRDGGGGPAGPVGAAAPAAGAPEVAELLCGKYRLDRTRTHPLLADLPDVVHFPARVGRHPEIRAAIDLLGRETDPARLGAGIALPGLLDLLLVYLVRAWLEEDRTGRTAGWSVALSDPVVAVALRALHDDPSRPWTTSSLSAAAGVSRATLARRFTALLGRPPMAYLTWWRMTRAAVLLRDPGSSLDRVAREVGYSSAFAFSHAFKRTFGRTPGRYRTETATHPAPPDQGPAPEPAAPAGRPGLRASDAAAAR